MKICGLTRAEDVVLARDLGAWALGFVFAPSPRRLTPAAARGLLDRVAAGAGPRANASPGRPHEATAAPLAVGVFGDMSAEDIARIVEQVGLDAVQLHGASGPEADSVREALAGYERPLRLAGPWPVSERPAGGPKPGKAAAGGSKPGGAPSGAGPDTGSRGVLIIQAVPVASRQNDPGAFRDLVERARAGADVILLDTRDAGRFGGTGTPFPWTVARESATRFPILVAGGIDPNNVRTALAESSAWGVDASSGVEVSPGVKDARLLERLFAEVAEARRAESRGDDDTRGDDGTCTEDEDETWKGPRT